MTIVEFGSTPSIVTEAQERAQKSQMYRDLEDCMKDKQIPVRLCFNPEHAGLFSWCMQHQTRLCLYCNPYYATARHMLILDWLSDERYQLCCDLIAKGDYPKGDYDHIEEKGLDHTP